MVNVIPAPGGMRITGEDGQSVFIPMHAIPTVTQAMKQVVYRNAAEEHLAAHQELVASAPRQA